MPTHNANLRAEGLLAQWNFPNNYTLSKHLSEYMVADYQQYFNLPVAIMRPTLISSCARDPYPGEGSCALIELKLIELKLQQTPGSLFWDVIGRCEAPRNQCSCGPCWICHVQLCLAGSGSWLLSLGTQPGWAQLVLFPSRGNSTNTDCIIQYSCSEFELALKAATCHGMPGCSACTPVVCLVLSRLETTPGPVQTLWQLKP
jgi:hypothetical protein